MQHTTTMLILKTKLAHTILTQKARLAGVAYNVQGHINALMQAGGLPCHNATGQAVALNATHNANYNFASLPLGFAKLYNAYANLNLTPMYMVRVTPTPIYTAV
jgi:hypothetical protein